VKVLKFIKLYIVCFLILQNKYFFVEIKSHNVYIIFYSNILVFKKIITSIIFFILFLFLLYKNYIRIKKVVRIVIISRIIESKWSNLHVRAQKRSKEMNFLITMTQTKGNFFLHSYIFLLVPSQICTKTKPSPYKNCTFIFLHSRL